MRTTALIAAGPEAERPEPPARSAVSGHTLRVEDVYEAHFSFVWRTARRLGVHEPHLDDVVQEVFVVVQRRLADFEGRADIKTWLFSITRHIVRSHFRQQSRRPLSLDDEMAEVVDRAQPSAESQLVELEGTQLLHALLEQLPADKREVFVLSELEEMSGPEIAAALDLHLSNVYARIRAARQAFDQALRRQHARLRPR